MALAVRDKLPLTRPWLNAIHGMDGASIFIASELHDGTIMPRRNTESVVKIAHIAK